MLAIAIHARYNEKQLADHPERPLLYPDFSTLPDDLKYSNLRQAQNMVERLVAGPNVYICNECIELCNDILREEVEFGSITTGASNDIEQATRIARAMITRYGMSDEFDMVAMETLTNQYLGGDTSLACSAETQALIDKKVVELVRAQHQKALSILQENKRKMDELAEYLYFRETITGEEFMKILTRKPMPREIPMNGSISDEEADYVSDSEDAAFTAEAEAGVKGEQDEG